LTFALNDLKPGMILPNSRRTVIQEKVKMYAEASGDFNPIHLDPAFGEKMGLGGTVAHGMLILAYLSTFMTEHFGLAWLTGGSINVRFKAPARPGDIITISGKVNKIEPEAEFKTVFCEVLCQNQTNEVVITGETKVRMK
jgi:3-hydroxybutyryl-CoA dehydratase